MDAGLQVMSPGGSPNSSKRRNIDVSVYAPSGTVIYKQQRVFQDIQISAPATEIGTYKLWCVTFTLPLHAYAVHLYSTLHFYNTLQQRPSLLQHPRPDQAIYAACLPLGLAAWILRLMLSTLL